jgi:hypothetical protein
MENLTPKEIFVRAVKQALANGMTKFDGCEGTMFDNFVTQINETDPTVADLSLADQMIKYAGYVTVILSHDFAKAFWGEEDMWYKTDCTCGGVGIHINDDTHSENCAKVKAERGYKFHLQKLAIAEDRLQYLVQFLK